MNSVNRVSNITKASIFVENGTYYLSVEGGDNTGTISIPKINIDSLILTQEDERINGHVLFARKVSVEMKVEADQDGSYASFKRKPEPIKEMTVAQIQKELGYKIKIKECGNVY